MTANGPRALKVLLLGGTSEATFLAERLAGISGIAARLSLAGRTASPRASALPIRIGGFGGAEGLADYLVREGIDVVIDATHPFAAQISNNAINACSSANIRLVAVERPPWSRAGGDDWIEHDSIEGAIAALPEEPLTIFSALGRQSIQALTAAPQHTYVIRVVDPVEAPTGLASARIIASRGPFRTDDDIALFEEHGVDRVLAKNSGGSAAYAKIEAARRLGLKVHMVRRPKIKERPLVSSVDEALAWIGTHHARSSDRGV